MHLEDEGNNKKEREEEEEEHEEMMTTVSAGMIFIERTAKKEVTPTQKKGI